MSTRLLAPDPPTTSAPPAPPAGATSPDASPLDAEAARVVPGWLLHGVGLVAFLVAAYAGRTTVPEGGSLALTWPAAGVGCTWLFFSRGGRRLAVAVVLLAVGAYVSNATSGAAPGVSGSFLVSNVSQALVFVAVLRHAVPDLWGLGGRRGLADVRTVGWTAVAGVVAAAVGALTGWLGFAAVGSPLPVTTPLAWTGRNVACILLVFALVHLVGRRLAGRAEGAEPVESRTVAITVVVTVVVFAPVFSEAALPLSFLPVVATLWVGLRTPPVVVAVHALVGSTIAVAATTLGMGPFVLVESVPLQAVLVQLFAAVVLLTGLFLAAARTERLAVLAQLREEQAYSAEQAALLRSAIQAVSDGLMVVGGDGRIVAQNQKSAALLELLGKGHVDRVGVTPMRRTDGTEVPLGEGPAARALRGELVAHEHVVIDDADGFARTLDVYAAPLTGSHGEVAALATFRDVTEELAQIDELAAFAGVVAHDLRGPMTTLLGWSEAARDLVDARPGEIWQEELAALLGRIHSSTTRLDRMVGNLLLHATSRDRSLDRQPVDLGRLVADVAATRGVEEVVVASDLPAVCGDPVLLRHLVDNLVGNAVKFARPEAPVRVQVHGRREEHDVVVRFVDNGIGVPEPLRRRVFQRFERVPGTGLGGTGMGLSICQTIVERHGGDIHVEDGPDGVGSTFVVRLPAAR